MSQPGELPMVQEAFGWSSSLAICLGGKTGQS